jgi:two-component system, response regulator
VLAFSGGLQCTAQNMSNGGLSTAKIEIILAEDKPPDVTSTVNTLKKANICNRVHVVRDGKELLDFLFRTGSSAEFPAPVGELLILLSLRLSDAHGLDVLRKIKNDERTKTVPIIILTSSQEERGVMQSYKLGANAAIVKPLDLGKLVEAVSELRLGWLLVSAEQKQEKPIVSFETRSVLR